MWFCFIPCEIVTVFSLDCGLEIVGGWVDDTLMLNHSSTSISHHFTFQHVLLGHRPPVCSSCRCAIAWHGRVPLAYGMSYRLSHGFLILKWYCGEFEYISTRDLRVYRAPLKEAQCCPEISQTRRNHQGPRRGGGPSFHGNLPSTVLDNIQYIDIQWYTHINTHTQRHRDTQTQTHTHKQRHMITYWYFCLSNGGDPCLNLGPCPRGAAAAPKSKRPGLSRVGPRKGGPG